MQKVINAQITRNVILILLVILYSFFGFAQKKNIKSSDDYILINNTIERYFETKKIRDSIFLNSDLYKEHPNHRVNKNQLRLRKKSDTIYIPMVADKFYYKRFLKDDARWKREKRYKKIRPQLDSIFSDLEVTNYKKQLEDNNYVWNKDKIDFKDRVFVISDLDQTRGEISEMSKTKRDSLLRKSSKLTKHKNVYTFSKPIFSVDKDIALITYSNIANNVLLIYEKKDNNWYFKYLLSENHFVDKIEER